MGSFGGTTVRRWTFSVPKAYLKGHRPPGRGCPHYARPSSPTNLPWEKYFFLNRANRHLLGSTTASLGRVV